MNKLLIDAIAKFLHSFDDNFALPPYTLKGFNGFAYLNFEYSDKIVKYKFNVKGSEVEIVEQTETNEIV